MKWAIFSPSWFNFSFLFFKILKISPFYDVDDVKELYVCMHSLMVDFKVNKEEVERKIEICWDDNETIMMIIIIEIEIAFEFMFSTWKWYIYFRSKEEKGLSSFINKLFMRKIHVCTSLTWLYYSKTLLRCHQSKQTFAVNAGNSIISKNT